MLQDCAQGIIFPDVYGHLAKWCALKERSLVGGVSQSGFDMPLGFLCSGLVVVTPLGWTAIFMCLVREFVVISFVMILYVIFVFASNRCSWCDMVGAPCCVILTSVPYLVLRLVKLSHGLSTFTLMQQIPLYFNGLYDYEIHVNAVLSTLPFFLMFVTSHLVSYAAHYLLVVRKCTLAVVRKSLSTWVPTAAFAALILLSQEHVSANIACLIVAVSKMRRQLSAVR